MSILQSWPDHLDPRVKSFLKLNELIFKPYDAVDLQHIFRIRVEKALEAKAVEPGVIEKGGKHGRGISKCIVVIAVEVREPKGFGQVRMSHIPDASGFSPYFSPP